MQPALPTLDSPTLSLAIAVFGFLIAAIAASSARTTARHSHALFAWSSAMGAAGVAFVLYFLRGYAPWLLTFGLANTIVMLIPAAGLYAHSVLLVGKPRTPLIAAVVLASFGVVIANLAGVISILATVSLLSCAGTALFIATSVPTLRYAVSRRSPAAYFSGIVTGLCGVGFLARAGMNAMGQSLVSAQASNTLINAVPLLLGAMYIVVGSLGFFAMVHELQREEALEASRRDSLTGVLTRAAFFESANAAVKAGSYVAVMVDMDHFKRVNDTYGHQAGDVVLAHAARLIASAVRITDIVGRYGGEEFCILLPGCDAADARAIVNRMLTDARSARVRLPDNQELGYTLSIGYAHSTNVPAAMAGSSSLDLAHVIARADKALYEAKATGRNKVVAGDAWTRQATCW